MLLKFTDMTLSPIFFSNSLLTLQFVVAICKSENEKVVEQMTKKLVFNIFIIWGLGQASDKKLEMGSSNEYLLFQSSKDTALTFLNYLRDTRRRKFFPNQITSSFNITFFFSFPFYKLYIKFYQMKIITLKIYMLQNSWKYIY